MQGCHNHLTINPKERTPNPEIIMETLYLWEQKAKKNPNIPNLHNYYANEAKLTFKSPDNIRIKS